MYDVIYKKHLIIGTNYYTKYSLNNGTLELLGVVYRTYDANPTEVNFHIRLHMTKITSTGYLWWKKVIETIELKELEVSCESLLWLTREEYPCLSSS